MMRSIFTKIAVALFIVAGLAMPQEAAARKFANRAERIVSEIHNPDSKYVVVISHRGDWRNYPENSIPGIESVIRMGVDVMELDLMKTKDGEPLGGSAPSVDEAFAEVPQIDPITGDLPLF